MIKLKNLWKKILKQKPITVWLCLNGKNRNKYKLFILKFYLRTHSFNFEDLRFAQDDKKSSCHSEYNEESRFYA